MQKECYKYFETCEHEKRGCYGCFNEKGLIAGKTRFNNVTKFYIDYVEVTKTDFIKEMERRIIK